ncbi:MAG: YicC family protein [Desulfovibrionaceae bacterium]|jgi:uncharacterized protein (TIGR00255 family)|nr:YicC family protein [Desulfovibrionaceae bacterium]
MLKSMTGYGRAAVHEDDWNFVWEVRSVNSRYLDLKWRLPLTVRCLENAWEKVVREFALRGRVELSLALRITRADLSGIALNDVQAEAMVAEMERFAARRGDAFAPDYNRMLNIPSLWSDDMAEPDEAMVASLEDGLRAALEDWNQSRGVEGAATARDLTTRFLRLGEWLEVLKERTPEVKEERFAALDQRVRATLERYDVELDGEKILQEIALLSDKLDVSEELSRLSAHLDQLDEIVRQGADAGKRLDFTLQECFREINTCGNKAQDTQVSRLVVDFKAELEKCREQVQNVE